VIRTLASTENPLFSQASISAAAAASSSRCMRNHRITRRQTRSVSAAMHLADYDLSERFKRSEVLAVVEQVETVIAQFDAAPATDGRQFFLACLLSWKSLAGR
jgi:hypothetical protein